MKQRFLLLFLIALLMPMGAWAALSVGDTFTVSGITYKVTSISPREVQVGEGTASNSFLAIDKATEGAITIPSRVTGTDGSSYSVTSIGHQAFYDCGKLTSISLPSTIVTIGDRAFALCMRLTSLELPSSLKTIGVGAFRNCNEVKEMTIPSSVNSIGDGAFQFSGIKELTVENRNPLAVTDEVFRFYTDGEVDRGSWPAYIYQRAILRVPKGRVNTYLKADVWKNFVAIVEIGKEILKSGEQFTVDKLTYEVKESSKQPLVVSVARNDSYKNLTGKLEIPSKVKGTDGLDYTVRDVNGGAFNACNGITSVVFPSTMEFVGGFENCTGLTSVTIPEGVKQISGQAFMGCKNLANVTIPSTVTTIYQQAFSGCFALTSLFIPANVSSIYSTSFGSCRDLGSITVDANNKYYDSRNNCNAIIRTAANELIRGCNNTVIPDGITAIGKSAFSWCTELSEINIPEGVETIGESAFNNCTKLASIHIPSTVTRIGDENYWAKYPMAFEYCGNLSSITVASGNKVYDSRNNCNALMMTSTNQLVRGCANTVIPDEATMICHYAFSNCTGLKSIRIPNHVTEIGYDAFQDCENLESITIPNSVTEIGEQGFANCYGLSFLSIGANVAKIGARAFINCYDLQEVRSYIKEPFTLSSTDLPLLNTTLYVPVGTKALYEDLQPWSRAKNIIEMVEDNNLTYDIGDDGKLSITGTVNGEETNIEIPNKIVIDGKEYIISIIAADAFKDNTTLESVTIPETIEQIEAGAFAGCTGLKELYVLSETPISLAEASARGLVRRVDGTAVPSQFDGIDFDQCVLYVPYGCGEAYRNAYGWSLFKYIEEMVPEGIRTAVVPTDGQPADVYTPAGVLVKRQATTLEGLKKGVYIVGGKKVVIQ